MKKNVLLVAGILMIVLCGCATGGEVDTQPSKTNESLQEYEQPNIEDLETMQNLGDIEVGIEDSFYEDFYGEWQIQDYLTANIYALPQEEIEGYLSSIVTYSPRTFDKDGQEIDSIEYSFEDYTKESLGQDYNIDISSRWTDVDKITQGTIISDDNFFGKHFFIVDSEMLWIYYEGVLFEAKAVSQ